MTTLSVQERETTLLEVLDRLLDKGVVVVGDLTLSVAEVDLIFASLRLVVTSMDKAGAASPALSRNIGPAGGGGDGPGAQDMGPAQPFPPFPQEEPRPCLSEVSEKTFPSPSPPSEGKPSGEVLDPDKAANGLAKLALTLVELLRKLLEREALRRMERGTLTPWEMERLGQAFSRLEEKMQQLLEIFNLRDEDLNLDLGPLGKLL